MKIPERFSVISEAQAIKLGQGGITPKDFVNAIPFLSHREERWTAQFGKLNLMFYIDRFGSFLSGKSKSAKIALAIYSSLEKRDKTEVTQYLMDHGEK